MPKGLPFEFSSYISFAKLLPFSSNQVHLTNRNFPLSWRHDVCWEVVLTACTYGEASNPGREQYQKLGVPKTPLDSGKTLLLGSCEYEYQIGNSLCAQSFQIEVTCKYLFPFIFFSLNGNVFWFRKQYIRGNEISIFTHIFFIIIIILILNHSLSFLSSFPLWKSSLVDR